MREEIGCPYSRKKLVAWRVAVPLAGAMIALAPVGVGLNVQLPVKPLLAFFALFTASAAVLMLSVWQPQRGEMSSRGWVTLGLMAGSGLGVRCLDGLHSRSADRQPAWFAPMAERIKPRAVKRIFGGVLLGVAALMIVKDVVLQQ